MIYTYFMHVANVIKRYFFGQVVYYTGFGWSNVSARALNFADLDNAHRALRALPEEGWSIDQVVLGRNRTRVFNRAHRA